MSEHGTVPTVLVIGSINMDLVQEVERAPEGGETLLGRRYSYVPGGKGANQAVAAARLGLRVTFVGRVGGDAHGRTLLEHLSRERIDREGLIADIREQTGFAAITVESSGQNRIVVFPGANLAIRVEDVVRAFERRYDAILVNLEIPQAIVEEVCRLGGEKKVPVILDAGPARDFDFRQIQGLEVISPNESETRAFTGLPCGTEAEAVQAARKLADLTSSRFAVLKLGERGALLYASETGQSHYFPGYPVKAVDTTAAGDGFTAGLAAQYLLGGDMQRAVRYANVVGALTVTRLGAQPSLPLREEVERFIQERAIEV
jgi:ribokinase